MYQRQRNATLENIEQADLERTRLFIHTYHEINRRFASIFQKLSPGGSAKMLLERPDKPLEGGVAIEARPRRRKIASLAELSNTEKILVPISFYFATVAYMPSPFFIMDAFDDQLDDVDARRISAVIKELSASHQFLVISCNEVHLLFSDRSYRVSMHQGITNLDEITSTRNSSCKKH